MTTFDYILLAVAAVVLIYQVQLLLRMKRDVLIPGVPPHRKTVGVLMALAGCRTVGGHGEPCGNFWSSRREIPY